MVDVVSARACLFVRPSVRSSLRWSLTPNKNRRVSPITLFLFGNWSRAADKIGQFFD